MVQLQAMSLEQDILMGVCSKICGFVACNCIVVFLCATLIISLLNSLFIIKGK